VLHGELVRDHEAPGLGGPAGATGQLPSWAPSQHGQNGQSVVVGDGQLAEATKRRQVEAYLAALGPDQLAHLTTLGPRAAARELTGTLTSQGLAVSERYVQQIFDDWTAAARQQANGRRRTR
jgi:AraC-like DNA-binding protein